MRVNSEAKGFARLCAAFMLCMLVLICLGTAASAAPLGGANYPVQRTADPSMMDSYKDILTNDHTGSLNAGRVWADKSVFAYGQNLTLDSDEIASPITISADEDFLVAFSAMSSTLSENPRETVPLDVVFVLDASSSMDSVSGDSTRIKLAADAINDAINSIVSLNDESRIGLTLYGRIGYKIFPLYNFVPQEGQTDTKWLTATSYKSIKINATVRALEEENKWSAPKSISISSPSNIYGSTNLQSGIAAAMDMLATEPVTTYITSGGERSGRIPVIVIVTDGMANVLCASKTGNSSQAWYETDYANYYNASADNNAASTPAIVLSSLMSAAYGMARVDAHYSLSTPHAFGIGIDIGKEDAEAEARIHGILNPTNTFNGNSPYPRVNTAYKYYHDWYSSATATIAPGSIDGKAVQIGQIAASSSLTKEDVNNHLYYIDEFYDVKTADLSRVFTTIIEKVSAFFPVEGSNDAGSANELTYVDPIGKYMEVKDVKSLLLFGTLFPIVKDGEPVGLGNGVTRQYYRIDYSNADSSIVSSAGEITNPNYKSYLDDGTSIDSSLSFDLNDFRIYVETTNDFRDPDSPTPDQGYDQALYVHIPNTALPLKAVNLNFVITDSEKELRRYKVDDATPLRLFYTVGIRDDVLAEDGTVDMTKLSLEYKKANLRDGAVRFYANYFSDTKYSGYITGSDSDVTRGDATVTFSPNFFNRYYHYNKALPLYKSSLTGTVYDPDWEQDAASMDSLTGLGPYVTSRSDIDSAAWYYIVSEYYVPDTSQPDSLAGAEGYKGNKFYHASPRFGAEFGSGIGSDDISRAEFLCWYNLETEETEVLSAYQSAPDNNWVIAAKPGGLRTGDMADRILDKDDNPTGTSSTYYVPTISHNSTGNNIIVNVYEGNNGVMSVVDTRLLITKTVRVSKDAQLDPDLIRDEAFRYQIYLADQQDGVVNVVLVERNPYTDSWERVISDLKVTTDNEGYVLIAGTENRLIYQGRYVQLSAADQAFYLLKDAQTQPGVSARIDPATGITTYTVNATLVPVSGGKSTTERIALVRVDPRPAGSAINVTSPFDLETDTVYAAMALTFANHIAEFTLKHGNGIAFLGLTANQAYWVRELISQSQYDEGNGYSLERIAYEHENHLTEFVNDSDVGGAASFGTAMLDGELHYAYQVNGATSVAGDERVHYLNFFGDPVVQLVPNTGDDSHFGLWFIEIVLSLLCLVAIFTRLRRQRAAAA